MRGDPWERCVSEAFFAKGDGLLDFRPPRFVVARDASVRLSGRRSVGPPGSLGLGQLGPVGIEPVDVVASEEEPAA